ncbi:MAG: alkaline phosphatase family protein [Tannerella sp.]|jgi:hypothetical protein|nr:alkaline phosphatase family protein [Tannerella sp.]
MKKTVFIMIAAACMALNACRQTEQHPEGIEHVIIIGLDGMSTWGLLAAPTPCMDSLMQHGACNFSVRSILPSVSTPNWTAMMAGVGPEGTGAINNSWKDGVLSFPYVAMTPERRFPNIFRIIREQKPGAVMGSIHNWGDFANMYEKEQLDLDEDYDQDAEVARRSAAYIREKKPNLMFCYFTNPDGIMHGKGHLSPAYLDMIATLDGYVRTIVDAVHEAGIADRTVIMVTSDHGGLFYAHGGNSHEELATPFIFFGKGVKKNYRIRQQMYRYDLAADIAFALGLTAPQQWTGRPTKPAYTGFDEPANLWPSADVLPSPALVTKEINENFLYGGLWVDTSATLAIQLRPDTQGDIRYTLDGTEPTEASPLYTAPVKLDKPTAVKAKLYGKTGESLTVSGQYRIADTKAGNGLRFTLYHCPQARSMPAFSGLKPAAQGTCFEFGFHTPENAATMPLNKAIADYEDHIAVTFEGWLEIDQDNEYDFDMWSTGGSKLFIGNELIVNNRDNGHSGNHGRIELQKGRHPIRIEFFHDDTATGSILFVSYEAPGIPKRMIPAEKLFLHK